MVTPAEMANFLREANPVLQQVIDKLKLGSVEVDDEFKRASAATADMAIVNRINLSTLESGSNGAPTGDLYRDLKRFDAKLSFCLELFRLKDDVARGGRPFEATDIAFNRTLGALRVWLKATGKHETAADDAGSATHTKEKQRTAWPGSPFTLSRCYTCDKDVDILGCVTDRHTILVMFKDGSTRVINNDN